MITLVPLAGVLLRPSRREFNERCSHSDRGLSLPRTAGLDAPPTLAVRRFPFQGNTDYGPHAVTSHLVSGAHSLGLHANGVRVAPTATGHSTPQSYCLWLGHLGRGLSASRQGTSKFDRSTLRLCLRHPSGRSVPPPILWERKLASPAHKRASSRYQRFTFRA